MKDKIKLILAVVALLAILLYGLIRTQVIRLSLGANEIVKKIVLVIEKDRSSVDAGVSVKLFGDRGQELHCDSASSVEIEQNVTDPNTHAVKTKFIETLSMNCNVPARKISIKSSTVADVIVYGTVKDVLVDRRKIETGTTEIILHQ